MESQDAADKAIKSLDRTFVQGKRMFVERGRHGEKTRIVITKIREYITHRDLITLFEPFGCVNKADVAKSHAGVYG